jgi:hypothetical protein
MSPASAETLRKPQKFSVDSHSPTHLIILVIINGVALEGGVVDLHVRAGGSINSTALEVDVCPHQELERKVRGGSQNSSRTK